MIETMKQKTAGLIKPGQTIGILGGGQLGRMVILEGRKLGYRFVTLDPAADCPGGQVSDRHVSAPYDDQEAARRLAEAADLIVYEFENIDPEIVKKLEQQTLVPQGSRLLELTRHRLMEKQALTRAGVPVAPYVAVETEADLRQALAELGLPAVLKTATGGYDGKGQWMLKTDQDVAALPAELFQQGKTLVLEQFIPFQKECSVVVARSVHGEVKAFPPSVNLHRHHILHMSVAPAPLAEGVAERAVRLAEQVADSLGVVGLVAVEMFVLASGELLVNELAPRPHNSGHYTFDACLTSQFEQFVRAVVGLPLGPTTLTSPAVMVNILGEHGEAFNQAYGSLPGQVKVHWYGKEIAKKGRKMGHVTVVDDLESAIAWIDASGIWPPLTEQEKKVIYDR
ncbi:5-(carboxyamino)imidazole ribonucleotide synthase [Laceyella sacchari]|jgi:5-(carboxyamino)imidazole ribonucleotide synthase|uniref:N5-carboxyaminoimidazole ribonucleotide synthase n=1 Tax=Laceyella sacchari TaxID=37482 RepID=A0ABY5U2T8_LACSH|nr:5-(carboxyamino)imidazole ribonucleotide synthase [Laceyella sacchari]UWE03958.1 5-(carboxyamino)imidazole ribonucleotide synthase [Laceyella sacchari]